MHPWFAVQKEKRLPGLAAHAIHPISTGKLEGFNDKIKVAKRIGYGYRDDDFFFTLIRYLFLLSVHHPTKNRDEPNLRSCEEMKFKTSFFAAPLFFVK